MAPRSWTSYSPEAQNDLPCGLGNAGLRHPEERGQMMPADDAPASGLDGLELTSPEQVVDQLPAEAEKLGSLIRAEGEPGW